MRRHVERFDAECEIDRIDVFQGSGQVLGVDDQKSQRKRCRERTGAFRHNEGERRVLEPELWIRWR